MTQPIDIIKGAMRSIGALATGEQPTSDEANDAFLLLNDLLDQWSNQKMLLFCVQEVIHELSNGKYNYTIGNNTADLSCTFTGSITGTVLTVTAITSGALSVGQILTGTGITSGTAITSYGTGLGGNTTSALGTYNLQLSNTFLSGTIVSYPPRPLIINSAFVRIITTIGGALDYPVDVISVENYERIGLKSLNGPWPTVVYYQPSLPLGVLNYFPNPNSAGEMHLFCNTILNNFSTLTDTVTFPAGYNLALRFCLAELLLTEYPRTDQVIAAQVIKQASEGKSFIKKTNMIPQQTVVFDPRLPRGVKNDAGWILSGGFLY